ncbi:MAG: hypothetical protein K2X39_04115, partial [Silvanigrellaceae bacterium]|nr:hypothetical protein [Silvanigrellaceae bacterium]
MELNRELQFINKEKFINKEIDINEPEIEQVFNDVLQLCSRSETKLDLHPNKDKDLCLAMLLEQARVKYGEQICNSLQQEYERTQPQLSFLFAQLTNAVLQSVFRQGRCHGQAAYALFELFKAGKFNATL